MQLSKKILTPRGKFNGSKDSVNRVGKTGNYVSVNKLS